MKRFQARQGDILIEQVAHSDVPKDAKPVKPIAGRCILAEGEVTGHHHSCVADDVDMFVEHEGTLYLRAPQGTEVTHQEHDTEKLPEGTHRITRQREYSRGEVRRVLD